MAATWENADCREDRRPLAFGLASIHGSNDPDAVTPTDYCGPRAATAEFLRIQLRRLILPCSTAKMRYCFSAIWRAIVPAPGGDSPLRAYLVTTGILFGLIAVMHLVRSIEEWPLLTTDPWHYLFMSALGVVAAALSVWAWCLLQRRLPSP
jgi:hypothetical protein